MCGIAGIFHYAEPDRPVSRDLLERMTRSLAHRGPDGEGFFVGNNIGFGHRRLSIVDLSPTGAQPMSNADGSCWITYNGEAYNHAEFRPRLAGKGCRFRGSSDSETILHLLDREGPDSLSEVAGIFGLGFWNGRTNTLTLARDHLGVKQVYFHDDGHRIVFASEIKALLVCPDVPAEPDVEGVNQYLHFHTAIFERTCFKDIRQLRAGEYLEITRHGARLRTYWSLDDFTKRSNPTDELIEELGGKLTEVVGDQLMSDVPVGSFFSGGIDSSAIAAYASRTGKRPSCFGVHFSGQSVVDEQPYQEAAAKALGLDLQLITLDGSGFADDLRRLMYYQDEPVIGSAMFPMYSVSRLASRQVKVCLGGQAADEVFGGYARYALGDPLQVIRSWFAGRYGGVAGSKPGHSRVGGNLSRQAAEAKTIFRLIRNFRSLLRWEDSYFAHTAKVTQSQWNKVFADPDFCRRDHCRQIFHEKTRRFPAAHPVDKIMLWDVQTYLTGLFHQDDRMSMAASLESRVPFADPRLVRFAFRIRPSLKLRGGASKWILRQSVSDVLPESVLNRRKVGFDTPAESWMKESHADFVRDTLLSSRARQRGFWNAREIESLLESPQSPQWFDIVWKVLCLETWASIFLDGRLADLTDKSGERDCYRVAPSPAAANADSPARRLVPGHFVREWRELGIKRTLTRAVWEAKTRSGFVRIAPASVPSAPAPTDRPLNGPGFPTPFADPKKVHESILPLISAPSRARLASLASEGTRGRILCFGRWMADFGNPVDWHRDPLTGSRWDAHAHWSRILRESVGEVKFVWEAGRFPQAYHMARAAVLDPAAAPILASAFGSQIQSFVDGNPRPLGVHWSSGQEIAFRVMAWLFGIHVFSKLGFAADLPKDAIWKNLAASGGHIADHIEYARHSVYNNHLLSEALGLYIVGSLLGSAPARAWVAEGRKLLSEQADIQVYADGSYIQNSHNYHRVALQTYLWAVAFTRNKGASVPAPWLKAIERSLDFLLPHQNPGDGQLPNYGANDGSLPVPLSSCDYSDFRPSLQAACVMTRGERIYPSGPWDEMSVWLAGPEVPRLPLRSPVKKTISFPESGYHVLRGRDDATFGAFRCGTIRDRFSQIDMLHLDIWWRGQNVLADPGSYLYNGPARWHNHFMRTESHNTVQVDGFDQMVHFRQFKCLYWTEGKLLRLDERPEWVLCEGEHYGFRRNPGGCVHRRSVLFLKDDLWAVVDTITGSGNHRARLHWLAADYPWDFDASNACLQLTTPEGPFSINIRGPLGEVLQGDVVAGDDRSPRGWLSRYYGEKTPAPSFVVEREAMVPLTFVTLLSAGTPRISVEDGAWTVETSERSLRFRMEEGCFCEVAVETTRVPEFRA